MDEDLCPPYWPALLWWLHHHGPINYPPEVDKVMAGVAIHSLSYLLSNQAEAERIRVTIKKDLVIAVEALGSHMAARQKAE